MTVRALSYTIKRLIQRSLKAAKLARTQRWRYALRRGVAATVEHDRLPLAEEYRTVIDVGANRGQFAIYARERFPAAMIYSIEPLGGPRSVVERLLAGDSKVKVLAFAAGASEGTAVIHVTGRDDSSSLLPPTAIQTGRFPGTSVKKTEQVVVRPLDTEFAGLLLARPALLKIDVQGFELEVLKGSIALLDQIDAVMTECSFVEFYAGQPMFDDIYAFLRGQGFRLAGGAISAASGATWEQGDFVFKRDMERQSQEKG